MERMKVFQKGRSQDTNGGLSTIGPKSEVSLFPKP